MCVDSIRKLFTEIRYSELGTNARVKEEAAFMYLIDYLDDCERGMRVLLVFSRQCKSGLVSTLHIHN